MIFPSWRDWLFSAKAFAASMLALYIALAIDLPRPYWAMTTVYVVANPLSGATTSKALYRALGTLIGAAATIVLVPSLVEAPELLSLAVAVWTGSLLYVALLDRTPRSYVFMLAGYTLPLIALPAVSAPETIFDVAVARSEEIILGIVCASVVGGTIFPMSVGPVLAARVTDWLRDAGAWASEILRADAATSAAPLGRQRLATDVAALDVLIGQLSHDAGARDTTRWAQEVRGRLLMLLPVLSSLSDRLRALTLGAGTLPHEPRALAAAIADWIKAGPDAPPDGPERFRAALRDLQPSQHDLLHWHGLMRANVLARLGDVVDLWQDCLSLRRQIAAGSAAGRTKPVLRHRRLVGNARHYDHGLMLFSAGSAVLATFVASLIWIYSGWSSGANFVALAAVACCFFGALDRPAPSILAMFTWAGVAQIGAGVFLFAVLPLVHDFETLALVLAPPFLLVGAFIPRPQLSLVTLMLATNGAGSLALQSRYSADFALYVNEGMAVLAGYLFAWTWTLLTKPFGAEIAARRLVRAGWTDLADMAAGSRTQDHAVLASRTLDRLGQLVPRLAADETRDLLAIDGLAELRIGYNILDLQRDRRALPEAARIRINAVLAGVSALFRQRVAAGGLVDAPTGLLADIDQALDAAVACGPRQAARDALQALVGLRRALFPDAPGPADRSPSPSGQPEYRAMALAAE